MRISDWSSDGCSSDLTLPGGPARIIAAPAGGLDIFALDAPQLFERPGNPYLGPDGRDWPDNHLRYGALCRAAARIALQGIGGWRPDAVHSHDWQGGLLPPYLNPAANGSGGAPAAPPTLPPEHGTQP